MENTSSKLSLASATQQTYSASIVITGGEEGDRVSAEINGVGVDPVTVKGNTNETAKELAESINTSGAGVVALAVAGVVKVKGADRFALHAKAVNAEGGIVNGAVSVQGTHAVQPVPESMETPSEENHSEQGEDDNAGEEDGLDGKEKLGDADPYRKIGGPGAVFINSQSSGLSRVIRWISN